MVLMTNTLVDVKVVFQYIVVNKSLMAQWLRWAPHGHETLNYVLVPVP